MALTENIKHASTNVVTGETNHVYYDDVEWAQVLADRAASALPKAQAVERERIVAEAQAEVDAISKPPAMFQGQIRYMELLKIYMINGAWGAGERAEADYLEGLNATAKAVRVREAAALATINSWSTVGDVVPVVL